METKKMMTKYISILLFIFVFAGALLLGATTAQAEWNRTCADITPGSGECIIIGPWTLKAFVGFDSNQNEIPLQLGVNWPKNEPENNRTVFRYITGLTYTTTKAPNQSYVVFNWPTIPLGGDPPGAQLSLDTLYAECGTTIPEQRIAWKLNRKSKEAILDIYMPLGTEFDKCGSAWIKWSSYCGSGGPLWVAKGNAPLQTTRIFANCAGAEVTVEFDECSGAPKTTDGVHISYNSGSDMDCPKALNPELCFDNPNDPNNCYQDINLGPRGSGAVICTYPPVYVYGVDAWFCPLPPLP